MVNKIARVEASELANYIGEIAEIHGSIYKIRKMSGFAFVLLRTKREIVQCIHSAKITNFGIEKLIEESCVVVNAKVVPEERSKVGYKLQMINMEILSVPEMECPIVINNKRIDTSIENLLDFRPITLRNAKERAIFKIQEGICRGFRKCLEENQFTEIHTPKIVSEGAEGGANIFSLDYFGNNLIILHG